MNTVLALLAISVGAAMGALLRYALGLWLNGALAALPMGTLAANLLAAYIVGVAIAFLATAPELSPNWRLFIITGLAGGLSTFSTFSAELLTLLRDGQIAWSAGMVALHLGGSVAMTALGMLSTSFVHHS